MTPANQLATEGVVVIPIIDLDMVKTLRKQLESTIQDFPEFVEHPSLNDLKPDNGYVLGGFGALGNPSSFHNPLVRMLREWIMAALIESLFREVIETKLTEATSQLTTSKTTAFFLECIVDRLMARPIGATPSKETWHRDEAPAAKASDITYGGWVNLDTKAQYFSCIPGSHTKTRGKGGFTPASKEKLNKKRVLIPVPPGSFVIFYEHILHEVTGKKMSYASLRLFQGWRISRVTRDSDSPITPPLPLTKDIDRLIREQGPFPMKSCQCPPMHAALHWTNWRTKLEEWSARMMDPRCIITRRVMTGKKAGDEHKVVERYLASLSAYGFPMYQEYSPSEYQMLKPNQEFSLRSVGSKQHRTMYLLPSEKRGVVSHKRKR